MKTFFASFFGGLAAVTVWYWAYVKDGLGKLDAYVEGAVMGFYGYDAEDEEDPDAGDREEV